MSRRLEIGGRDGFDALPNPSERDGCCEAALDSHRAGSGSDIAMSPCEFVVIGKFAACEVCGSRYCVSRDCLELEVGARCKYSGSMSMLNNGVLTWYRLETSSDEWSEPKSNRQFGNITLGIQCSSVVANCRRDVDGDEQQVIWDDQVER
nr:hypothetical protein CFP56_07420 [Quercus suber]